MHKILRKPKLFFLTCLEAKGVRIHLLRNDFEKESRNEESASNSNIFVLLCCKHCLPCSINSWLRKSLTSQSFQLTQTLPAPFSSSPQNKKEPRWIVELKSCSEGAMFFPNSHILRTYAADSTQAKRDRHSYISVCLCLNNHDSKSVPSRWQQACRVCT